MHSQKIMLVKNVVCPFTLKTGILKFNSQSNREQKKKVTMLLEPSPQTLALLQGNNHAAFAEKDEEGFSVPRSEILSDIRKENYSRI